jgi:hypothetical protein
LHERDGPDNDKHDGYDHRNDGTVNKKLRHAELPLLRLRFFCLVGH